MDDLDLGIFTLSLLGESFGRLKISQLHRVHQGRLDGANDYLASSINLRLDA